MAEIASDAREDAARRIGVAAELPVLISADSVTGSDGSLGYRQPNVLYTQPLVPGYRGRPGRWTTAPARAAHWRHSRPAGP